MEVVHVCGIHQAMHGGVDRRGGAPPAMQAEVERSDHLVLAVDARIDIHQRSQPVQSEDSQSTSRERPEVTPGTLDPEQLHRLATDRVDLRPLGRGVAAGVVGVAGI